MTIEQLVEDEMKRIKPNMTTDEWHSLETVLRNAFTRLVHATIRAM
jgi:hypothetical protein